MIDAVWRHNALPLAWFKIKGIPGIILFLCYFSQKHQNLLVISCLQKYFKGKRRDSNEQQRLQCCHSGPASTGKLNISMGLKNPGQK